MKRPPIIYTPRGRADEYARNNAYPTDLPIACNLAAGCPVGCIYCYTPDVLRIDRQEFHSRCIAKPDAIARFEAGCKKLQDKGNHAPIFLSFTTRMSMGSM